MTPTQRTPGPPSGTPYMRGLAHLFLALILLSNPFLHLFHAPGELSVHHPARHRATIGSSELQHFSPVSAQEVPDGAVAKTVAQRIPAPPERPLWPDPNDQAPFAVAAPEFSPSLWFRPPPAL